MTFNDLGLAPLILKAVEEAGYETPTPIQAQAVPHAIQGRDVLGIAQTGTGKTASFTLPMLTILSKGRARARMPRSLILAPTRELAAQVSENFDAYGKYTKLSKALLIGGVSFGEQDKIIDRGVDVLIATPGRLLDHFERGKLMLTGIEIMVVDEADRMLDMGFIEDLERIFKLTPFTRQTLFFSATMPPEITRLTNEFLSNPVRVEVARQATTAETVEQRLCALKPSRKDAADREKRAALRALINAEGDGLTNAIVFCNRKRDVSVLYKSLTKYGFNAGALHGDLDQRVRMQVLDGFRRGEIKILVASDVAARGLDIPTVSHVFNFDVPLHAEDYVHRIGRTGRAGRTGVAITLALPIDDKLVAKVEDLIKKTIPRTETPDISDLVDDDGRGDRGGRRSRFGRDGEERGGERGGERGSDRGGERRGDRSRGRGDNDRRGRDEDARSSSRLDVATDDTGLEVVELDQPIGPGRRPDARARRRNRGDRRDSVIGLGDHVPAFLLREVKLPSRKKSFDGEEAAEETGVEETGGEETGGEETGVEDALGERASLEADSPPATPSELGPTDTASVEQSDSSGAVRVEEAEAAATQSAPKAARATRRRNRKKPAASDTSDSSNGDAAAKPEPESLDAA